MSRRIAVLCKSHYQMKLSHIMPNFRYLINPGKMHTKYTTGFLTNLNAVRPAVILSVIASKLCVVLLAQVLKPSK